MTEFEKRIRFLLIGHSDDPTNREYLRTDPNVSWPVRHRGNTIGRLAGRFISSNLNKLRNGEMYAALVRQVRDFKREL